MKRIYKYTLGNITNQAIHINGLLKILSIKEQNNNIVLYALIEDEDETINVISINMYGTGHPIINAGDVDFLGTVKLFNGSLMFHVFYSHYRNGERC